MSVDTDSDQPEVFASLTRSVNMNKGVVGIYRDIRTKIRRPEPYRGTTNLAGVLAYAKRIGRALERQRMAAQAHGKRSGPAPRIVVTIFTDGLPEGRQSKLVSGPWPESLTVWFFGVKAEHEARLAAWASEAMGLTPETYRIVLMNDWEKMAASVYGHAIGRPHQQLDLLKRLQAARNGDRS